MARRPPKRAPGTAAPPAAPRYDEKIGKRAFEELTSLRADLGAEVPRPPALSMTDVATLAVRVGTHIAVPEVRARFTNVEKELPAELVDRVVPAAWALWYATRERAKAKVKSRAVVPLELVARATELRARMLRVLEYWLVEDDDAMAELADIKDGRGHSDLASDLGRLADLYDDHARTLAVDTRNYEAADSKRAREAERSIVEALAAEEDTEAQDAVSRSFRVLDDAYARVRRFALAIFDGEGGEQRFPDFYSVRAARTRTEAEPEGSSE